MRRILFWVPGLDLPIYAYGFMLMLGFIFGILLASKRAKKRGMNPEIITDLALYLVVFGVLGARIFYVIEFNDTFSFAIFNIFDGRLSLIGLGIGVVVSSLLFKYREKINPFKRFHPFNAKTVIFFTAIGLLITLSAGRFFYILTDSSVLYHRVLIRPYEKFYPDTIKRIPRGGMLTEVGVISDKNSPDYGTEAEYRRLYTARMYDYDSLKEANPHYEVYPAWDFSVFEVWKGGLVFYGGIIGGIIGGLLFAFRRRIPFFELADVVAPAIMLGLAFGRVGCTMNGCCWGKIPDKFVTKPVSKENEVLIGRTIPILSYLTIRFPPPKTEEFQTTEGIVRKEIIPESPVHEAQRSAGLISENEWTLPVYATEPLNIVKALLLCLLVLIYGRKWKKYRGDEILFLGVIYPIGRFLTEFLRGDNKPEYLFGLTVSQSVGIFVAFGCLTFWMLRRRWLKKRTIAAEK